MSVQNLKCLQVLRQTNGNRIESVDTFILSEEGGLAPDIFKKGKKPSIINLSGDLSWDEESLMEVIGALMAHTPTGKKTKQLVIVPSINPRAEIDEINPILKSATELATKVEESTGLSVHIFPKVGEEILHFSLGKYQKIMDK